MPHAFIPVPNVARVELIYSLNGIVCENVFNVQKGTPYTLAQLQALRGTVNTWDGATWAGNRGGGCLLQRIRTKALDTASSPTEDFSLPVPRAGGFAGPQLPANVSFSVKLATGMAGRSQRGRLYVAGLTINQLPGTNNQLSAVVVTSIVAALNTLMTNLAAAGHTLGVVSYMTGKAYRAVGQFTAATGWVAVDSNLDAMRRRLTGRGI